MRASGLELVSEAELHGFVDGGLDSGRRDAVQLFLAASPEDAARVETWRRQNERIRAAFESMNIPPLPWPAGYASGGAALGGGKGLGRGISEAWRERWFARLIGLAFMGGVLLTASADYFTNHVGAPDDVPLVSTSSPAATPDEVFAAQAISALRAFGPPPAAERLSPSEQEREQELAVPVLPSLLDDGLTLTGVRAMPGEQGQMLCMFYARKDAGTIALCAEKTPGPSDTVAHLAGKFPLSAISWRQSGANYALAGTLSEPDLRALADAVRAQVEVFSGK